MGCDIHLYVERRTDAGWEYVSDRLQRHQDDEVYDDAVWADPTNWYHGRNYNLFAILADVRNGRGFAGVKTGDGFVPIDPPRGLPGDVSAEVNQQSDEWGSDGHSHSWFTVGEILSYDWDQTSTLTGLFHDKDAGHPNGGAVEWVQHFADTYHELPSSVGTWYSDISPMPDDIKRVTWQQPYYRCAGDDWWATVARAFRLSKGLPADVRFVFWFDN